MLLLREAISRGEKGTKNVNFFLLFVSIWAASSSNKHKEKKERKKKHVLQNRGVCWKSELMKNAF